MNSLKILYAASNNYSSRIQLERFSKAIANSGYNLKVAAYKKSSPIGLNIDWTLDCLYNIFKPNHISLDNENFEIYFDQVRLFNPDLIISDLEYFTSYIANVLNITLWQCSSSLLNFALPRYQKYNLGLFKQYYYIFHKVPLNNQRIMNMIDNSSHNFVYSHFGDANNFNIKDQFEWIRPYHTVGSKSKICEHNLVAGMIKPQRNIISLLRKHYDSVLFCDDGNEYYPDILTKDIKNEQEYACNLRNSNLFICGGQTSFLADAFYNGKHSLVLVDHNDIDSIINSVASEKFELSTTIYDPSDNIDYEYDKIITPNYSSHIKLLHERISEI